ncbi:MAG: ABC transporter permease [Clostridia bacterium]|nr:ABC transporter permease [Clostridia bacterium]
MKTYLKTLLRTFKKHVTRFLSIIFMVLVSVGFISGIGSATDKINFSLSDHYAEKNVSDFIIKCASEDGFSDGQIAKVKDMYGANNVNAGMSFDVNVKIGGVSRLTRLYFIDFNDWTVNIPDLTHGAAPADKTEIYSEASDNKIVGVETGAEVTLDFADILKQLAEQGGTEITSAMETMLARLKTVTLKVSGVVQSPLTFARDGEPSYKNPEDTKIPDNITDVNNLITLENILYVSKDVIPTYKDIMSFLPSDPVISPGDLYVALPNRKTFNAFDRRYDKYIVEEKQSVLTALAALEPETAEEADGGENETYRFITLNENYSFCSLHSYGQKVKGIGIVLMVAFIFVTALVVLSTMTRLLEEERGQIACLKTLGYSAPKIIFKYILFAMLGTGIGGAGAYFVGLGLAYLLCGAFNFSFAMPPISSHVALGFFLITFFTIVAATLVSTLIAGLRLTREKPANLLRPKPPKAGKKVFLERIPFIWNALSFKYKSTMRNVLRYKSRFFMTVIAVGVSMALVLAGLGLLDLCLFGGIDSATVLAISLVVVVFAGLLTMVVVYTLTNINISERNKELATLQVLGYHGREIAGYIYREIYIDTAVGIIVGYPLSLLVMWLIFSVMAMGSIGGVTWFWWLIAPVIVLFFTFLVTMVLRRKIVGIDMNESLKANE